MHSYTLIFVINSNFTNTNPSEVVITRMEMSVFAESPEAATLKAQQSFMHVDQYDLTNVIEN